MRNEQDVIRAMEQYADTVRRLCMIHLKSYHDSEDIFQNVFLKYVLSSVKFESEEHEKAWFIRVTINACKDLLKNFFRRHTVYTLLTRSKQMLKEKLGGGYDYE